ncbi:MAG: mandelate racemase, partial [Candidatus Latescibacterota bacterium]|nr:mandelate racemase [Candidatus Latescibacterota bacterium]
MSVTLRVSDIDFRMRNVRTRMPFRYGVATLTSVPILHITLTGELGNGNQVRGYSADILPPKWFDKDPAKQYQDNVEDLLFSAESAARVLTQTAPASVFEL